MKRVIPLLLLAGCPKSGPGAEGPGNVPPPAEAGPVAVLTTYGEDVAIPMACYAPNQDLAQNPDGCAAMIGDPATAASPGGATAHLTGRGSWDCAGEVGEGLGMRDYRAGREDAGKLAEILIAPAERVNAVKPWTPGGEVDAELAAAYQPAKEAWMTSDEHTDEDPDAIPRLVGTLEADFDGDGGLDAIYTVHPSGEVDEYGQTFAGPGPRVVLARLSSRPGELVELLSTTFEDPTAFAAFDLDGKNGAELFYDMPYYEGDSINLARIVDGQLEWVGGWGCGL